MRHVADPRHETIPDLVRAQAALSPAADAIVSLGGRALTYGDVNSMLLNQVIRLNELGIGRGDRVALVLPNGPAMAMAFLSIASAATCAPLNPTCREHEFEFFLSDLRARAVIIGHEMETPARAVAHRKGLPVIELVAEPNHEGLFTLTGTAIGHAEDTGVQAPEDLGLILHTSGTTSRPKMVPLTHRNLCVSAEHVRRSLLLTGSDRCLNVMPLFHIHGLVAAVLASFAAGGSVTCAPGFQAPRFFEWLEAARATWYTAVPTMHQAILARAAERGGAAQSDSLRFVRSSSAALPPQVKAGLEEVFQAPAIEAYGMTEAAHQICSNPLPPRPRKASSVGIAAGPEVAVMDEAGRLLSPGEMGEVVVRGRNVTHGYLDNPEASAAAFVDGWFRTGDQGFLDPEGYLFLTGRIKEIINRGGEKISPREVDEILLDHPAVAQAVAFAVPDQRLGEDVAAAVVLRPQASATERQLRTFVSLRLAEFKVPCQILILEEIPKGPTGKVQRIGLAEKLGLVSPASTHLGGPEEYVAPRTPSEEFVATLWREVLRLDRVGVHDRFLAVGGDSLLATLLLSRVRELLGIGVSMLDFFDSPTIADQARLVEDQLLRELDAQENSASPAFKD